MLLVPVTLAARSRSVSVVTLSNNQGLSNSAVNTIFQDSEGLLWFGTWDGLNRYDGNSFFRFPNTAHEATSISHPVIREISEESPRYLWVTTDHGVNRLDKYTGRAERFMLGYRPGFGYSENSFTCAADGRGHVAASCYRQGLYLYHGAKGFLPTAIRGLNKPPAVIDLFFDCRGLLWIYTPSSLLRVTFSGGAPVLSAVAQLPGGDRSAPVYDGDRHIWLSRGGRLYNVDIAAKSLSFRDAGLPIDGVLNAVAAAGKDIVAGTSAGCFYIVSGGEPRRMQVNAPVLSLLYGSQKILWAGTDGKGISQFSSRPSFMEKFTYDRIGASSFYPVRALLRDAAGSLWVGTKGGGLSRIEHFGTSGESHRNYSTGTSRADNSVLSLASGPGRIWIGTDGPGISYYDYALDRVLPLPLGASPQASGIRSVYCILPVSPTTLYVGTSGHGLYRIDLDASGMVASIRNYRHSGRGTSSLGSDIVYALADGGSCLWVGTRGGGLSRLDKKTQRISTFKASVTDDNSLCSNDIISLMLDSRGRLWTGTTSGLCVIDNPSSPTPRFHTLDSRSGLPDLNIHSIREDYKHNIWAGTSRGLVHINGASMQMTPYFFEDGLQDNEFSDGAGYADTAGRNLFFGGVNGFNLVRPADMESGGFRPRPIVKTVLADSEPVVPEEGRIRVPHNTNTITLDLAVCDYLDNRKYTILYRLEPLGHFRKNASDWVNIGSNRSIILNQLSPGTYRLLVKVAGSSTSDPAVLELTVEVARPLWATWWAISVYILAVALCLFLFYRSKKSRLLMRHELDLARQEKINKENTHQAKLRFFTNIAHEFSNSITLIYGSVEQLLNSRSPVGDARRHLVTIRSNADRMRQQISELMEFRKAEQGYLKPSYEVVTVPKVIRRTVDNFLDNADARDIALSIDIAPGVGEWVIDLGMLEKVLFNLISNALKYTPDGGDVTLSASLLDDGRLRVRCSNTGPGIPPDHLADIFDRFTVLDNFERKLAQGQYSRTGIGLALCKDLVTLMGGNIFVESQPDCITTFSFTLPPRSADVLAVADRKVDDTGAAAAMDIIPSIGDRKPSVLIIDDQSEIRSMIAEILGAGYDCTQAASGPEAFGLIEKSVPDLVICDIIMPGMSGIEVVKRIRLNERTRYLPVIILSSKSDMESRIEVMQTGANLFVHKPFHPQYLLAAVGNLLRNHTLMREFSESSSAYKEKYDGREISKEDRAFIDKAVDLLSLSFSDEDYTPDRLASELAISRVQLYRRLRSIADTTPGEFIRSFRLERAMQMLVHTDKTIQEIMTDCGFHNKAYFYRIFQKQTGCTPKDFRKNNTKS